MMRPNIKESMDKAMGRSRKNELDQMMSAIKNKANGLPESPVAGNNPPIEDEYIRKKLLGSLFEVLQSAGVDPNDLASISKFLRELETQSPDLYNLFQYAFDALSGNNPMMTQAEGDSTDAGLMERYSNLGPETMMPNSDINQESMGTISPTTLPKQV
jgi:hypothetical protein